MDEEKQIEKLSNEIQDAVNGCSSYWSRLIAEHLYNENYRKQEWISVEDRLPDNYRAVLVVCESTTISGGTLRAIGSYGGGFWSLADANGTLLLTKYMQLIVTHWMELPEIPKMKGGAK